MARNFIQRIDLHLKAGKSGSWEVRPFTVSEQDAKWSKVRCAINGCSERALEAGDYWMLTEGGGLYMSNTPAEVRDHADFIGMASGSVLIAGLGLGMVVQALLDRGQCRRIVVVEKSQDVINLVAPCYQDPRVEIVCEDIFQYRPTEHFDYAWFDIWPEISGDNYPEMKRLHSRFARSVTFRFSWCRKEARKRYNSDMREA
jgi:hypothetical protein